MQAKSVEININSLAEELDLDLEKLMYDINSPIILKLLENDIKAGLRHKINGTPSYVIDGVVYEGFIPSEIIKEISAENL